MEEHHPLLGSVFHQVMISIEEYLQHNDHVELLWYPYTTTVLTRQLTRTEQPATEAAGGDSSLG